MLKVSGERSGGRSQSEDALDEFHVAQDAGVEPGRSRDVHTDGEVVPVPDLHLNHTVKLAEIRNVLPFLIVEP